MNENPHAPKDKNRRRHPRIESINSVGYVLFDDNGKKITTGKGRTLNLSQSGTLLKTRNPVQGAFVVLVTIDLEGTKIKIKGRVRHSRRDDASDYYLTGIEFMGTEYEQRRAIVSFVKTYQHRKNMAQKSLF